MPATPIDPDRAAELRAHVEDPFFPDWLPGLLSNQDDARPIRALAFEISEDLEAEDAELLRRSLHAMPTALEQYMQRPGRPVRDRTILKALGICVEEMLAILDRAPEGSMQLLEDRG